MYITAKDEIKSTGKEIQVYISIDSVKEGKYRTLFEDLKMRGIGFYVMKKNPEILANDFFVKMSLEYATKASIGIVLLDDDVISSDELYGFSMLECGILLTKKLFLLKGEFNATSMDIFQKSPVRDVQMSNPDEIVEAIDKYLTLPKNIFRCREIDQFAQNRISYIRFLLLIDCRYSTINKIYQRLRNILDDFSLDDTYALLEKSISTGLTLFHFGKKDHMTKPIFWPYMDETKLLMIDFPVRSALNKIHMYNKENGELRDDIDDNDIISSMKMEFIIPNHELLGVSFQAFIQIEDNTILPKDIKSFLLADGIKEEYIHVIKKNDKARIYFPIILAEDQMKMENIDYLKEEYGEVCSYFYPK